MYVVVVIQNIILILMRCINCSYNNIARSIDLPEKNCHFCLCRLIVIQVGAFAIGEPLIIRLFQGIKEPEL